MSSEFLNIECKLKKSLVEKVKTKIDKFSEDHECFEKNYKEGRGKLVVDLGASEVSDFDDIEKLVLELQTLGVKDILCYLNMTQTGGEFYMKLYDSELHSFDSMEDLKEFETEKLTAKYKAAFDYGKNREDKTALVRLDVKAKGKRKAIIEIFTTALKLKVEDRLEQFTKDFNALIGTSEHVDMKWCGYKWKDAKFYHVGPDKLINGIKFVVEEDKYVYLGFDLEDIPLSGPKISVDTALENLVSVFTCLPGADRAKIKFRIENDSKTEIFVSDPPPWGDDPFAQHQDLSSDHEWM